MKERPILFNAPIVRALLAGQKTQTRRAFSARTITLMSAAASIGEVSRFMEEGALHRNDLPYIQQFSPYGQPGDRLWVRESFWGCDLPGYGDQPCVVYDDEWHGKEYAPAEARPWGRKFGRIPSIHMPRNCSRITLEIVSVRVERLQDISEADAIAEGVTCENVIVSTYYANGHHEVREDRYFFGGCQDEGFDSAVDAYAALLESINGAGSWEDNPWLWVVEFRRLS